MQERVSDVVRRAAVRRRSRGVVDPATGILLTGSPRSGTTWVGQILAAAEGANIFFEPLHPRQVPEAAAAGFAWRTTRDPAEDWPEGRDFLHGVLIGQPASAWTLREAAPITTSHWVAKCVRANRLLPWIQDHVTAQAMVLVVRDPVDVVASQLRSGWQPRQQRDGAVDTDSVLGHVVDSDDLPTSPAGLLARSWAMDNAVPLAWPHAQRWLTVRYEDLVADGAMLAAQLIDRVGLTAPTGLSSVVDRPSSTTGLVLPGREVGGALDDEAIADVATVVRAFGLPVTDEGRLDAARFGQGVQLLTSSGSAE